MITGPKNHRIPFSHLESPFFRPNLKYKYTDYGTCGDAAISLVTGINPKTIRKQKPTKSKYWTIPTMIRFLESKGYITHRITKNAVLDKAGCFYEERLPINVQHVLISDNEVDDKDASFFVFAKNSIWHNFEEAYRNNPLFFLARPIQDIAIVTHPKWR
jgi:hypothetical protein